MGLHRAGHVDRLVTRLAVRGAQDVALVRAARGAGAGVPGDMAEVVDAEQLVEGRVGGVVEAAEGVPGRGPADDPAAPSPRAGPPPPRGDRPPPPRPGP